MIKIDGKDVPLVLNIIVGDEKPEIFDKCLGSWRPYVDRIIVGYNGKESILEEVLKHHGCEFFKTEWDGDFSKKRNEVYDKNPPGCLVAWCDSDDMLLHGEKLKDNIEEAFKEPNVIGLCVEWFYAYDAKQICNQQLWRERIVKREAFRWTDSALHETLHNLTEGRILGIYDVKIDLIDKVLTYERQQQRAKRNLEIIKKKYDLEYSSGLLEPKTVFDLARSYQGAQMDAEALKTYKLYMDMVKDNSEKVLTLTLMCDIYRQAEQYADAARCSIDVIIYAPHLPDGYIDLAITAYSRQDWAQCITFMELSFKFKPADNLPNDPTKYTIKPFLFLAYCYLMVGRFDEAIKAAQYALSKLKTNKMMDDVIIASRRALKEIESIDGIVRLYEEIKHSPQKLKHYFHCVPDYAFDHPTIKKAREEFEKK